MTKLWWQKPLQHYPGKKDTYYSSVVIRTSTVYKFNILYVYITKTLNIRLKNKHYVAICSELVCNTLKTTTKSHFFNAFKKSDFAIRTDAQVCSAIYLQVYSILFDPTGKNVC